MIGKTLKELGKALTEKKISSVELTQLHLDRIAHGGSRRVAFHEPHGFG